MLVFHNLNVGGITNSNNIAVIQQKRKYNMLLTVSSSKCCAITSPSVQSVFSLSKPASFLRHIWIPASSTANSSLPSMFIFQSAWQITLASASNIALVDSVNMLKVKSWYATITTSKPIGL